MTTFINLLDCLVILVLFLTIRHLAPRWFPEWVWWPVIIVTAMRVVLAALVLAEQALS